MTSLNRFLFSSFWWLCKHINMNWSVALMQAALRDRTFPVKTNFDAVLKTTIWNRCFSNPIGIAAGIDNQGHFLDELINIGFGFGEFGSLTLNPCAHDRTVLYVPRKKSIVNQTVGYPNKGLVTVLPTLINRRSNSHFVGINISPMPDSQAGENEFRNVLSSYDADFVQSAQKCAPYCDYFVLNLTDTSCNLCRLISDESTLLPLLEKVKEALSQAALQNPPKLVVKVPLTLTPLEIPLVVDILMRGGVDGVLIGGGLAVDKNTNLLSINQRGVLCGGLIRDKNTEMIRQFYQQTKGQLPIIACGGVFSGQDAFDKIAAGASLVQVYSALFYRGPMSGALISNELARILKSKGFASVNDAIGCEYI